MHGSHELPQYLPMPGRPELPKLEVPSTARERCALLARVSRDSSLFSEERLALLVRMGDGILAPTISDRESMPRVVTALAVSLAARWRSSSDRQPELQAGKERIRNTLAEIVKAQVAEFSPQELSHLAAALDTMKLRDAPCAELLASATDRVLLRLGSERAAQYLDALNAIGLKSGDVVARVVSMMLPHLGELPTRQLHRLMGLVAGLPRGESTALSDIAQALFPRVSGMMPRELATTARLFLSSSHRPMPLLAAVVSCAAERASEFTQRELLDMLRDVSELQSDETKRLFRAASPIVLGKLSTESLSASRIAGILGSYARVHVFDPKLFGAATSQLAGRLNELSPEQAVTAVWALAASTFRDEKILSGAREVILPGISSLEPHVLARLAWSYSVALWRDEQLFGRIAEAARDAMPRFPVLSLSSLAWSFANVAIADRALFEDIARLARPGGPMHWMRSGRIAWSIAVAAPDLVPTCFSRDDLGKASNSADWHQHYLALVVSGAVSPLEDLPRMAEVDSSRIERSPTAFEADVRRLLQEQLRVPPQRIDSGRLVAGVETDFIVRTGGKPVVIECDGAAYHRTRGPDGGTATGSDIIQDRFLDRCGYQVFRILSSDFYGPNRGKVVADLDALLRQERQRGPLPGGLRRLSP